MFRSVASSSIAFLSIIFTFSAVGQIPDKSLITLSDCWRYQTESLVLQRPAVDSSNLYMAERGGRISAISLATGARLWATELGGEVRSNIALFGSNLYVVAGPAIDGEPKGNGRLRTLSANTGIPVAEMDMPFGGRIRLVPLASRLILVSDSGNIAAVNSDSNLVLWQKAFSPVEPDTVVAWDDKIAFAGSDSRIYVISAGAGTNLNTAAADRLVSALGVVDNDLVWGDDRGNLVRYSLSKNSVYWRFKNGARISSIVGTSVGVVATSNDNFAYLISSSYGSVRWKKRLSGRIANLTVGDGGIAIAETIGDPNAVILDLDNGKSVGLSTIADEEAFLQAPVYVAGRFVFFTNRQVIARSTGQCTAK